MNAGTCYLRLRYLSDAAVASLSASFAAARPFPHVVIPDVLLLRAEEALPHFPAFDDAGWSVQREAYQAEKMTFSDAGKIPDPFASIIRELSSPAMLQLVERLTGIRGLLVDPYLQGAGLHCTGPNGVLAPHIDSHVNERLNLYRRVNLLIYLNPEWDESCGGCLELYEHGDVARPRRVVIPRWGTCVIFRSDAQSVHGFTRPVAGSDRYRRALAVYYYTSADAPRFSGYSMTAWSQHRPYWERAGGTTGLRRAQMHLYQSLRFGSKALAYLAHQARPRASTR